VAEIAQKAFETRKSVREVGLEEQLMAPEKLDEILLPENMLHLERFRKDGLKT
jgi:aspartate ammonia-lyase